MNKKKTAKSIVAILLALSLLSTLGISAFAAEEPTDDPELSSLPPMETTEVLGASSYDFTDSASQEALMAEAESYPESYDLRDKGLVTSVKLQHPFGTCWAFAACAAAESSLINDGFLTLEEANLSERHLAYFATSTYRNPASPQNGEGFKEEGTTLRERFDKGGNPYMAWTLFASGAGPVLETEDETNLGYHGANHFIDYRYFDDENQPFSYSPDDDWSVPYEERDLRSFDLKESIVLPSPATVDESTASKPLSDWVYKYNPAGTAAIKKQLMAGRAVEIGFLADQSSPNQTEIKPLYLSDKWAHYGTAMNIANHAVTIVGWDDNYPVENFLTAPDGPGAWLVKNSWGSGENEFPNRGEGNWGIENEAGEHTGYFWLSYYDHSISYPQTVVFEEVDENQIMDAHDYVTALYINARDYQKEVKMANKFTASCRQELTHIGFHTTHPSTSVKWQIYLLSGKNEKPDNGILVAEGTKTYEFGGFHKEELAEVVPMTHGQVYSIVITETLPNGKYSVNIPVSLLNDSKTIVNGEESLLFRDDSWNDISDAELRKELTEEQSASELPVSKETSVDGDNFSIKGYAQPMDEDIGLALVGKAKLAFLPDENAATFSIRTTNYETEQAILGKEWNVKWSVVKSQKGGDPDLLSVEPIGNGLKAKVSLKGETPKDGKARLCAEVFLEGERIDVLYVDVDIAAVKIEGIQTEKIDFKGIYTGSPITTQMHSWGFGGYTLVEGRDYTVEYKDNIKCGVAEAVATPKGLVSGNPVSCFFPIVPAKAVVKSVKAEAGGVMIQVEDQKASGLTGYEVAYREAGTSELWNTRKINTEKDVLNVTGLTGGKKYEIRVRGYIDVTVKPEYYGKIDPTYFGEYSDTVTSEEIQPGPVKNGWTLEGGKWYYYNADGSLAKGWLQDQGKWYYLDKETGAMATGWIQVNDVWYFLYGNGEMAANAWWDGYWLNADGSWTYLPRGSWKQNAQGWWYGDTSGWYCANGSYMINGILQSFNAAGYWIF